MADVVPIDSAFLDANKDIPDTLGGGADDALGNVSTPAAEPPLPSSLLTVDTLDSTFGFIFDAIAMMAGEGGEFWQLKLVERKELAKAWLPIVGPLLDRMGASQYAALATACGMTAMVVMPRAMKEKKRRASKLLTETSANSQRPTGISPVSTTDIMETEKSGDSHSSADLLARVKAMRPIV